MERKSSAGGEKRKHEDEEIPPTVASTSKGMECPACLQIPRGKIFQCSNGHSICDSCSTRVTTCPTCQSPGALKIRNHFAENLLNSMEVPCRWTRRGCQENFLRGQLSAHEDLCDHNPDVIKFCSMFSQEENCQYKFTPKWLSKPGNCIEFISHVNTCLGYFCKGYTVRNGHMYNFSLDFKNTLSDKPVLDKPLHHYFCPMFCRCPALNCAEEQVIFRITLLKVDTLGNKHVSFACVRLTPLEETTPTVVKFGIIGNPSSTMVSKWGPNSFPPLNWTQKVICLNEFRQMVDPSSENLETKIPLPFSFPASFLSEYYVDEDKLLKVNMSFE